MGELCLKYGVLVISDEIHRDLVFKDYIFTPFASINKEFEQNSITCTSASKTFNIASLKASNVVKAEATYLLWIDISNLGLNSKEFTKKLEELGNVRVISGDTFGENGDNFIRVNIACPKKILEQALNALKFTIENL